MPSRMTCAKPRSARFVELVALAAGGHSQEVEARWEIIWVPAVGEDVLVVDRAPGHAVHASSAVRVSRAAVARNPNAHIASLAKLLRLAQAHVGQQLHDAGWA